MNRRRVLTVAGCYLTAGCLSTGGSHRTAPATDTTQTRSEGSKTRTTTNGSIRPESEPETVPDGFQCERDDAERISSISESASVVWGDTETFALRASGESFEYGDSVLLALTNTSSESVVTGNKTRYNLELYTEAGWRDIRVSLAGTPKPYDSDGISHDPDRGFRWEIELSEAGVVDAPVHDDELAVCPELRSGRYRFVYWGIPGSTGIAVAFDLDVS